jgi:hypothetical protein
MHRSRLKKSVHMVDANEPETVGLQIGRANNPKRKEQEAERQFEIDLVGGPLALAPVSPYARTCMAPVHWQYTRKHTYARTCTCTCTTVRATVARVAAAATASTASHWGARQCGHIVAGAEMEGRGTDSGSCKAVWIVAETEGFQPPVSLPSSQSAN